MMYGWLLVIGILLGWFARDIRDLLRLAKREYNTMRREQQAQAEAGVITRGQVYSGGKRVAPNKEEVTLPDVELGTVVRSPSPAEVRKENDRNFKEDLAAGKFSLKK